MAGFGVIRDISRELRRQVFEAMETAPEVDFGLDGVLARLSLQPPTEGLDAAVIASLYLYHVEVDRHLRNQRPLPDPAADDLFRNPPLPLQLRYLFTPVSAEEETNQLLLGRVIQHFHDHPRTAHLEGTPLGDSHGGASPALRVRPDLLTLEQLSQIWNAFSQPYRVAVSLLVEVVAIDSAVPPERTTRVTELALAAGQGR
ncbi:DUF4255 domain-containing protein [Mangrovicoccus algicola]|uniref:DUF4255 domain-containing protein n=1 Tax=Mangrovicoccus algicola TaxID=2771008 RepID=A0A8J6Z8L7_9RHOB|nr:DUF4255 domain-containing protein [Mangrovicoccus algicola]MBE3638360.1 DUF4255 domain-containing protein [Mangrovicoccus algicola]